MKDSIILYLSHYEVVKDLPDELLGKLYRTIFEYELGNQIEIDNNIKLAFGFIYNQLKMDKQKYKEKCDKNKENGKLGGRPKKPNGLKENQNKPNGLKENPNDNDNENDNDNVNNNIKEIKKEKYGKYGRVKLTINEYLKLRDEYGEDFIKNQIDLLDEYIESNNNKNKYSNFNLVLRKSIRENWFKNKGGSNNIFLDIMKNDYDY